MGIERGISQTIASLSLSIRGPSYHCLSVLKAIWKGNKWELIERGISQTLARNFSYETGNRIEMIISSSPLRERVEIH